MSEETVPVRRVVALERAKVVLQQRISGEAAYAMRNAELEVIQDRLSEDLLLRMQSYVLREHLITDPYEATTTVEYPASTWQMFKHAQNGHRWFRWLFERRPVRMERVTRQLRVEFTRRAAYPGATFQDDPRLGSAVLFESLSHSWSGGLS